jgi:hypothetical protein
MTLLNSKHAAKFCTDNGRPTEEATLNTKRSTGGGPPFYKKDDEKNVWYDTDDLLEWCQSSPLKKYNSTSEYSTRKKKTPQSYNSEPSDTDNPGE